MADEKDEDAVGTRNDERIARLEEISGNADGAREGELVDIGEEQQQTEEQTEQQEEQAEQPAKIKITVNGKEMELTQDELIARASKVEAADQYLAHAKRQAEGQLSTEKVDAEEEGSEDLALARALQMGSEEEAAAVIAKIRKQSPSVDTDALATRAADRIRFEDASAWLQDEYKDIFADPKLKTLFIETDARLVAEGNRQPYKERYAAIGNDLRAWKGTTSFSDKEQRKSATVHKLPTAAARAVQPVEEEPDDTPSTVIAQMANKRGQANI